jgi:hypothetical protein
VGVAGVILVVFWPMRKAKLASPPAAAAGMGNVAPLSGVICSSKAAPKEAEAELGRDAVMGLTAWGWWGRV